MLHEEGGQEEQGGTEAKKKILFVWAKHLAALCDCVADHGSTLAAGGTDTESSANESRDRGRQLSPFL